MPSPDTALGLDPINILIHKLEGKHLMGCISNQEVTESWKKWQKYCWVSSDSAWSQGTGFWMEARRSCSLYRRDVNYKLGHLGGAAHCEQREVWRWLQSFCADPTQAASWRTHPLSTRLKKSFQRVLYCCGSHRIIITSVTGICRSLICSLCLSPPLTASLILPSYWPKSYWKMDHICYGSSKDLREGLEMTRSDIWRCIAFLTIRGEWVLVISCV